MKIDLGEEYEDFETSYFYNDIIDRIKTEVDMYVADRVCWTQNAIYWMIEDVIEDYNNNED